MKNRNKLRPLWILLSVAAGMAAILVLLASLGVFRSYRYDESGFGIGGGTVEGTIRRIEIDWLCGPVQVEITEDDRYPSVSEYASDELRERDRLRMKLDEDGKLTVMACASADFLPRSQKIKLLVVRIPAAMAADVVRLSVRVREGAVRTELDLLPQETEIRADAGGEIRLTVPEDAGFTLRCEGMDAPPVGTGLTGQDDVYIRLDGGKKLTVRGKRRAELIIYTKSPAE